MEKKKYSRVWNEELCIYEYVERTNYQAHKLTKIELLAALYLFLSAKRGVKVDPSFGQLSTEPYPSDDFLLETWDEVAHPHGLSEPWYNFVGGPYNKKTPGTP